MRYRRSDVAGGAYFFTVNLADRSSHLLTQHIELLRHSVREVRRAHPFEIVAAVVLPDHLHAVWLLPAGDRDFSVRWALVKSRFSRTLGKGEPTSSARRRKRERGIWQRRYWEHLIRDEMDLARHVDYVHYNPVRHGYAKRPVNWPYSSIHRYVRQGQLAGDWSAEVDGGGVELGERG